MDYLDAVVANVLEILSMAHLDEEETAELKRFIDNLLENTYNEGYDDGCEDAFTDGDTSGLAN